MTKKCTILFGSPNNHGNTAKLLDEFLRFCPENVDGTLFCAYDLNVFPCIGCDVCKKTGNCFRKESDDFHKISRSIAESDALVIAAPLYFLNYPAPLKTVFDRFQTFFYNRPFKERKSRKAVLLLTGGSGDELGPKYAKETARYVLDSINFSLVDTVVVKNTDRVLQIETSACQNAAKRLFEE